MEKIYFNLANALDVESILSNLKNNKVKFTYDRYNNYLTIRMNDKSKLTVIKYILKEINANFDVDQNDIEKDDFGVIIVNDKIKENILLTSFNKFLNEEKSTLTYLGVPSEVMKPLQKDLALSDDAKWDKLKYKYEIKKFLREGVKSLFLQINKHNISAIACYPTIKGIEFFIDQYKYIDDDWSGSFIKRQRIYTTYTQALKNFNSKSDIYKLDGDFSVIKQARRNAIEKEKSFIEFTDNFKREFIKKFDAILKRITGAKFKDAKGKIGEKAKQIAIENDMLIKSLDNPMEGPNGLSILDEFLYKFEDIYSEYFDERLDIQELTEYFSRDKVMTMLMYFIYKGKIMN